MATKKLQIIGGGLDSYVRSFTVSNNAPTDTNLLWIDPQNGLKYYSTEKKEWVLADSSSDAVKELEASIEAMQTDVAKLNGMTTTSGNKTVIKGSNIDFSTVPNNTIAVDKLASSQGNLNLQAGTGYSVNIKSSGGSGSAMVLSPTAVQLIGNALILDKAMYDTTEPSGTAKEGTVYFQVVG